jgi:hypothetical protein
LKKLLLIGCALALFAFDARTSQLALIVLNAESWGSGRLPSGWQIKVNHGKPDVAQVPGERGLALRLRSRRASFALERSIDVDPATSPWLTWRWKVTELPPQGDFRKSRTDDQAAQILVAFTDRRILAYIWDSNAPRGTMQSASAIPLVHVFAVVCRSGADDLNHWLAESRNVAEDYRRAFNRGAPRVKGLRLQINSQHTASSAESYFQEVAFRNAPLP